jgi:anthranilate 1,2-dioxygenase large subunit
MNRPHAPAAPAHQWPDDPARVPYWVYTDPQVYALEQALIFRGPTWSFVALDAELPAPGDFKATFVGDTPVVVTRDAQGALHAWVNRCAHRGALVCRELRGSVGPQGTHTCVYHQWAYDAAGNLVGVPFRKGLGGKGGYPADFDMADHGLARLRVAQHRSLIFASFSDAAPPLPEYLGAQMLRWVDRVFVGPIECLGTARQFIRSNWKLYTENTKDPYHASLLHLFHATFGVYRSSMGGGCTIGGPHGMHSILRAWKIADEDVTEYKTGKLRSYDEEVSLADPSLLAVHPELEPVFTNHIQSLFPGMVLQQIHNTLAVRQIIPKGVDGFELVFHFFGYADDSPEVRAMRLKQANFVGPAGYISMEDGEATQLVQQGVAGAQDRCAYDALGGRHTDTVENLVDEALIRSFWRGYRGLMGF